MCFFLYIKNHGIPENLLKTKSGEWIQATPVNGTVLDLVADCCPSGVIDYIEQQGFTNNGCGMLEYEHNTSDTEN
ncbi:uncharacterized protein LOC143243997 isoform X4 [Tachypleus tridentatus]|uniref:uncharacterized protein LOC143243997 isoform X4 n=1 Tax=Tachypleus tridentatus TaxID=6853 RepID=UPI003FD4E8F9